MLIVEGPDGSGKSTLVRRLSKDLGLPVAPRIVGSDTIAKFDLAAWTEQNVAKGFQRMLFDRHRLISEPIYGPILRGRQQTKFMDLGWMADMTWAFYGANPIILYCLPQLSTVWANVQRHDTDNSVVRSVKITEALYTAYVSRATMDFSRKVGRLYNYECTQYNDVLRWVKFQLEVEDDRAARNREYRSAATG